MDIQKFPFFCLLNEPVYIFMKITPFRSQEEAHGNTKRSAGER